ncbi:MAG: hypothetical protein QNJ17_10045 [Desulfocapsaceae bacterium]|nr:hypothetical protein [Desulfocapsaceae bacterium]
MKNKFTFLFTRREAELYQSHGLLEEAYQLYRQILDDSISQSPELAEPLQKKIGQLEKEMTEVDIDISEVVSERELNILRESWGDAQSPSDIGISASSLRSLGFYEAAIEEYGKLVRLGQPKADYIDGLTDCIVAVHAPEKIGEAVETIVALYQPSEAHPIALRIAIAAVLASRGLYHPALTVFQSASAIRPLPDRVEIFVKKIQKRLESNTDSIDRGLTTPTSEKGTVQKPKRYLANCLARLKRVISNRFLRTS